MTTEVQSDKDFVKDKTENEKRLEKENNARFAIARLRELKNLFQYLEDKRCKNRFERKQFRRDLYTNDKFPYELLDSIIEFYALEDLKAKKEE